MLERGKSSAIDDRDDDSDDDPDAPMSATAALSHWLRLSARADRGARSLDAHARAIFDAAPAKAPASKPETR